MYCYLSIVNTMICTYCRESNVQRRTELPPSFLTPRISKSTHSSTPTYISSTPALIGQGQCLGIVELSYSFSNVKF